MDLDGWEVIHRDIIQETHDDDAGGEKIFPRKYGNQETNNDFNLNHLTNPSPKTTPKFVDSTTEESKSRSNPNQLVLDPIQFHQTVEKNPDIDLAKETKSPKVFFKKEDESTDPKTDSAETESTNCSSMDMDSSAIGEEEKENDFLGGENDGNLKMWKWSLNGIGAVCSFGVAAVTVCIIIFGNGQTRKQSHHKLQLQIYGDSNNNKSIKQVMEEHGSRLNEAISAVRGVGVPFTRAQLTFGGHYEPL